MTSVPASDPSAPRYEARDASAGRLVALGCVLCLTVAMTFVLVWTVMGYLVAHQPSGLAPSPLATGRNLPPKPRLEVDPDLDLATKRAAEEAALHSYGWVDRPAGTVRIPIDRAMELLVQRGIQPHDQSPKQGRQSGDGRRPARSSKER